MLVEPCFKIKCLIGWNACTTEWLGKSRQEMWVVCAKCGKRRLFLTTLDDVMRSTAYTSREAE